MKAAYYLFIGWMMINFCDAQVQDERLYDIINQVDQNRLKDDVLTLVNFGTRHTLSDTLSNTRGIGAARRWIKEEFEMISTACGNCLEVYYQRYWVTAQGNRRFDKDTWVVSVVAVQRGTANNDNYVIMTGDIDSRVSDVMNATDDAPGANDNATGIAGTLEAARILTKHKFKNNIVYAALAGEEQGLYGGKYMAQKAKEDGWNIIGVMNNDMIGNIEGVDGVINNRSFRIFSEPTSLYERVNSYQMHRFYGGEVDGPSRQLARYIHKTVQGYMPELKPTLVYRLDRFGRGGHHRPFNDEGFAAIRIMESHENYNRQHQDLRTENGIIYGDVIEGVNFEYVSKLTAVNAINLAALAWAPIAPENVKIGGIVAPNTQLSWTLNNDPSVKGYKIYWRDTTSPTWQYSKYVGKVNRATLKGIVIDNYLFGVAAVGIEGHESIVSYPKGIIRD
jgi:Zn-dependent M28 family amino/carboxypeptidase